MSELFATQAGRRRTRRGGEEPASTATATPSVRRRGRGTSGPQILETGSGVIISATKRRALVAKAAFLRYLSRGADQGSPETDWLEAEAEVARRLGERSPAARE